MVVRAPPLAVYLTFKEVGRLRGSSSDHVAMDSPPRRLHPSGCPMCHRDWMQAQHRLPDEATPIWSTARWEKNGQNRRGYAQGSRRFLVACLLVGCTAIALGPAADLAVDDPGAARAWTLVWVAITVLAAGRILHMGIVIHPDRVIVRNFWRSWSLPSSIIRGFLPPPPYGALRRAGLCIDLTDGRTVTASAFAKGKLDGEAVGVAESTELNDWLAGRVMDVSTLQSMPPLRPVGSGDIFWRAVGTSLLVAEFLCCGGLIASGLSDPTWASWQ